MKAPNSGLPAIVAAILVGIISTSQALADNPPIPPNARERLFELARRESQARSFIRNFESFPPGVDVAKELKLTVEQIDKLQAILTRHRQFNANPLNEVIPGAGQENDPEALRKIERRAERYEATKIEIIATLSPEQVARLDQIQSQSRMRLLGMSRFLSADPRIDLTPEQVEKLRAAEAESQKQLDKEIAALREHQLQQQRKILADARQRVIDVLTPEQRDQFDKLVGPPLDVDERALEYGVAGARRGVGGGFAGGRRGFGANVPLPAQPPTDESKPYSGRGFGRRANVPLPAQPPSDEKKP